MIEYELNGVRRTDQVCSEAEKALDDARLNLRNVAQYLEHADELFLSLARNERDPADLHSWWAVEADVAFIRDHLNFALRNIRKALSAQGIQDPAKYIPLLKETREVVRRV